MALHDDEKAKLAKLLGSTVSIMASTVAKLYLASPDPKAKFKKDPDSILNSFKNLSEKTWTFTNVLGALVFVIDRSLDTFVFQIYDLKTYELRYEYELYEDIAYLELDPQFHCFEMEDCVAGFSFCNEQDAKRFFNKVKALKPSSSADNTANSLKADKKKGFFGGMFGKSEPKKKEIQIGGVVSVTHNEHIGLNADGTFDLNNITPEWKAIFKQAGIRKKDLQNPEIAADIIQTIAENTGMVLPNEVKKVIEANKNAAMAKQAAQNQKQNQYSEQELQQYYSPEQLREYEEYLKAVEKYERELAEYEREQEELRKWEEENERAKAAMAEIVDVPDIPPPPPEEDLLVPENEDDVFAQELDRKLHQLNKTPSIRITAPRRGSQISNTAGGRSGSVAQRDKTSSHGSSMQSIPIPSSSSSTNTTTTTTTKKAAPALPARAPKTAKPSQAELEAEKRAQAEAERQTQEAERIAREAELKAQEAAAAAARLAKAAADEEARARKEEEERLAAEREIEERRRQEEEQRSMQLASELEAKKKALAEAEVARKIAAQQAELEKRKAQEAKASKMQLEALEKAAREAAEKAAREAAEMEAEIARQEAEAAEAEARRVANELEMHRRLEAEAEARRRNHEGKVSQMKRQQEELARNEELARMKAEQARREAEDAAERQRLEEEQKLADDLARAEAEYQETLARIAKEEEEELRRQIEEMKERARINAEKLREFEEKKARRKSIKKITPPLPQRLPDKPALPPGLPPPPPTAPPPPKLPPLPPKAPNANLPSKANMLADLANVKLKQTETVDKSVPDVVGTRGRDAKTMGFLSAIEKGTTLKKTTGLSASSSSAPLKKMDDANKNMLMSKLVETMNTRRGALAGAADDSEDEWSD